MLILIMETLLRVDVGCSPDFPKMTSDGRRCQLYSRVFDHLCYYRLKPFHCTTWCKIISYGQKWMLHFWINRGRSVIGYINIFVNSKYLKYNIWYYDCFCGHFQFCLRLNFCLRQWMLGCDTMNCISASIWYILWVFYGYSMWAKVALMVNGYLISVCVWELFVYYDYNELILCSHEIHK